MLAHNGGGRLAAVEHAAYVDGHDAIPLGVVDLGNRLEAEVREQACVVHQDVDAAEGVNSRLDHPVDGVRRAHVDLDANGFAIGCENLVDHRSGICNVGHHNGRTFSGKAACISRPDALGRTADDGHLTCKTSLHSYLRSRYVNRIKRKLDPRLRLRRSGDLR
ncbi:hypothetical protein D3C87_1504000 [compost metagenome]